MAIPSKLKGRYEIKEILGRGGMGVVYRAYDSVIRREVALKTILDIADRKALELFHKEYQVLAGISHPNIVEIFDIGEFQEGGESTPYFVMPLLGGVTLDKVIRTSSHRLTVERSVEIINQTCRGLQAAHDRGLVHRDLKPSNIFVMDDDSVRIIDFGVVHKADALSTKGPKGTLLYMAPEVLQMKPPSPLSDIFSLGVVAYETLTQRRPFERTSEHEIIHSLVHHVPPPASDLNPAVSQAISQVIHKAMAKQPYHRFSSAREFAETLQKALRNERIEIFDPTRIQPRIQRIVRALEQADYQFADEILTELEAEGHIDSSIMELRRRVDQAVRQKRVQQLLESARTRVEEEEYPLALQKVQEVLDLDPQNAAALALKSNIESKRTAGKIEDWFRLARQHLDNHAYSHARQALQNVLQLKPNDTRARQLLAQVDRLEEEYLRVRQEKEQLYQAAMAAWRSGEISSALHRLERMMDLDRRAPDSSDAERTTTYQNFYQQVRSEHDAINNSYAEARKHLADGDFAKALAICQEYLTKYPGHALFQALKFDVEEQQRQQLSAYIAEVDRTVEAEPDLGKRVSILKEALRRHPGESHFERSLRLMNEKRDLVESLVAKARLLEEQAQFTEALGQWEILRNIYSQYAGLNFEIERVVKRRDQQARAEAKARVVAEVDRCLHAGDYVGALDLVGKVQPEFPNDAELAELEKLARQGLERTGEALRLFEQSQSLWAQGSFEESVSLLRKAHNLDEANAIICAALVDRLVERARATLDADWRAAETLVQQALDLDPNHALGKSLRTLAMDRKRQETVDQCISLARQMQGAGELEGALKQVEQGLASYPHEPRLAQLHSTLSREFTEVQRRQTRRRDLEELRRLDQEVETASHFRAVQAISQRLQALARQYSSDPEFQSLTSSVLQRAAAVMAQLQGRVPSAIEQPAIQPSAPPAVFPPSGAQETAVLHPAVPSAKLPERAAVPAGRGSAPAAPPALPATETEEIWSRAKAAAPAPPSVRGARRSQWIAAAALGMGVIVLAVVGVLVVARMKKSASVAVTVPVEVRTTPPGATIRINGRVQGISNLQLRLPAGSHRLEAVLEGYQPAVAAVSPTAEAPVSVILSLEPLPQIVRLYTDLDAGNVVLDEEAAGALQEGEFVLDNVPPGQHTLKVVGRQVAATVAFEAVPGAVPKMTAPLTAKELAAVVVSSLGSRARVHTTMGAVKAQLDGQPVGELGPEGLELSNLGPGPHELALGEGKEQRKMVIETGPAPALTAFLNSDRNVGTLVIVTGEDNVVVSLNGRQYHRKTQRGQLRIPNLEVKSYLVQAFKDGYQSVPQQTAQVRKGEETKLEFKLVPVPTLASMLIQGAPPGAEVFLDGSPLGTVQADGIFSASRLAPGEHTIELRKEQLRPRRITRRFGAGEVVQFTASEVAMETAIGTLHLNVSPADAQVTLSRAGEARPRVVRETTLNLGEGSYTLTAHARGYASRSATVQVMGGETKTVDLQLSRQEELAMTQWEEPQGWNRDGEWYVRKGGNFVLFKPTPTAGRFVFTAMLRKGRRLQWVINQSDERNYILFQIDRNHFYRSEVRNGEVTPQLKVAHGAEKKGYYTVQMVVTPTSVLHELYDGTKWIPLDAWRDTGGNFTSGKFGFYIPGNDEVALTNFTFSPQ